MGACTVTGIEFQLDGYSNNYPYNNQTVKLYHVTQDVFDSAPDISFSDMTTADETTVWTGNFVVSSTGGWQGITFSTNFSYNGTDNLLISWENRDGSWQSGYGWAEMTFTGEKSSFRAENDGSYPTNSNVNEINYRANIKIHYT